MDLVGSLSVPVAGLTRNFMVTECQNCSNPLKKGWKYCSKICFRRAWKKKAHLMYLADKKKLEKGKNGIK